LKEKLLRYGKMQQVPLSFNQWDYMKDANQWIEIRKEPKKIKRRLWIVKKTEN
jgi:hypothetical protein